MSRQNDRRTRKPTSRRPQLLPLRDVKAMTGLGKSTIYKLKAAGRFPAPVRVTDRAVRWILEEVLEFVESCPRAGSDRSPKE